MCKKNIFVSGYLEICNDFIRGRNSMKPIEMLLCLVIFQRIQAKVKKDKKDNKTTESQIKISKKYLSYYFNKKIITQSYLQGVINGILSDQCFVLRDRILSNFFKNIKYDGSMLYIDYNIDKLNDILMSEKSYAQIDLEYVCNKCSKSKNAIHLYLLICSVKSTGVLKIKKESLIYILGKDHIRNFPTSKLTRDIHSALKLMGDILGKYDVCYDNGIYTISFNKFTIKKIENSEEFTYADDIL